MVIKKRIITKTQEKNIILLETHNQHIPIKLQEELLKLKNVCCKDIIINFINDYKIANFANISEEYRFIIPYVEEFSNFLLETEFGENFKRYMLLALAQTDLDDKVKERFIHPIQNFLIGILIIDNFYSLFSEWIKTNVEDPFFRVETGWFLTSIYHDVYRTILIAIGDEEDVEEPSSSIQIYNEKKYIAAMVSLYEHLNNDGKLPTWNSSIKLTNEQMSKILQSYSNSNNHGVKSSLMFLRDLEKVIKQGIYHPVFILAAFSIAIHHHKVYNQLLAHGLMPLDISKFSFSCILLYCDAINEWNRGVMVGDAPELIDLKFSDGGVYFDTLFSKGKDVSTKLAEIDCIRECISSDEYLTFEYGARIRASR